MLIPTICLNSDNFFKNSFIGYSDNLLIFPNQHIKFQGSSSNTFQDIAGKISMIERSGDRWMDKRMSEKQYAPPSSLNLGA